MGHSAARVNDTSRELPHFRRCKEAVAMTQIHQTTHVSKLDRPAHLCRSVWIAALLLAGSAMAQVASNNAAIPTESLPAATLKKLHPQIMLALKQVRREPPFDKPTSLQPDIPIRDGDRVLVDVDGTVSESLSNQIALVGGQVATSPDSTHIIRAMVPLAQVEALAGRADIQSISPAQLTVTRRIITETQPPSDISIPKPGAGN